MELRVFTEPQWGASYDELLAAARLAEGLGFGGFFRSDHYLTMGGDGLPGPSDAWTTLAGLARDTSTIRLGTLMTSATFRHPGVLAIQVSGVDAMSSGRVELGIGAGWFTREHTAYGIPFPDPGERFDRLAEQLEVITGLWSTRPGDTYDFQGEHYRLAGSPALPKPVQTGGHRGGPPIIIGGNGRSRTPALAARYADEFNLPFVGLPAAARQIMRVRAACDRIGRDPGTLRWSAALTLCVGRTAAEVVRRAAAAGSTVEQLRGHALVGSPQEVLDVIGRYGELGVQRIYLQLIDIRDLEQIRTVADEVLPRV